MLVVTPNLRIPLREFTFTFARSSGPGGQNVNKVASKAVLRWSPAESRSLPDGVRQRFLAAYRSRLTTRGEIVLASDRYRDQGRNVQDCLARLKALLSAVAKPPKRRRPTRPSKAAKARRLQEKQRRSATKAVRRDRSFGDES